MSLRARTEQLVSTNEAADVLGVPAGTIRQWKHRGLITPTGVIPGPGRAGLVPLYRLEELQPLADRYAATRRDNASAAS